jgi:hypothetical protein
VPLPGALTRRALKQVLIDNDRLLTFEDFALESDFAAI